jgi:hypothetical protein
MPVAARLQLGGDVVGVGVLVEQLVHLGLGDRTDPLDQVVDAVGVDRSAESEFGFDFVAFGDRDVAHVVAEPGQLEAADGVDAEGGALPAGDTTLSARVGHVPGDRSPWHAKASLDIAELPVALRGLVEVHEVHVDLGPRQRDVRLRVQVQQRCLQCVEAGDPHLGRGEGVHPGDQPYAIRVGAGGLDDLVDRRRVGHHRLPPDGQREPAGVVELVDDGAGLLFPWVSVSGPYRPWLPLRNHTDRFLSIMIILRFGRRRSGSGRRESRCLSRRWGVAHRAGGRCGWCGQPLRTSPRL